MITGDDVMFQNIQGNVYRGTWIKKFDDFSDIVLLNGQEVRVDHGTIYRVEPEVEIMKDFLGVWKAFLIGAGSLVIGTIIWRLLR